MSEVFNVVSAEGKWLGFFVEKVPDGCTAVAEPPPFGGAWWINGKWQLPKDEALVIVESAIKQKLAEALGAGFTFRQKLIQTDEVARSNIDTMGGEARWAKLLNAGWPMDFAWRTADDSFLPLPSPDDMIALGEAAKSFIYGLWKVKWAHVDAVRKLPDGDAVMKYDFSTGWSF